MDLLNFFQFLQALLAIFVVLCLCTKGPVKHHCHVALVVLVISMMIIPPFGRNFLSAASMKEGATTYTTGGYKPHHRSDGIIDLTSTEKKALLDMTLFDFVAMIQMPDTPLTATQKQDIYDGLIKKHLTPTQAKAEMAQAHEKAQQAAYLQDHLKMMNVAHLADLLKPPSSHPTKHKHYNPLGPDVVPRV